MTPDYRICPVCGYDSLDEPITEILNSTYEICPSCGFEFGVTDLDTGFSYEQWRAKWIDGGMIWRSSFRDAPANWNPVSQLKNLDRRRR